MCNKINPELAKLLYELATTISDLGSEIQAIKEERRNYALMRRSLALQEIGQVEDLLGMERTKPPNHKQR